MLGKVAKCGVSCSCKRDKWWELGFSEKDEMLSRKLWKGLRLGFSKGSKWSYILSGYVRSLPLLDRKLFMRFIENLPRELCEECFIEYLKEVSRKALELLLEESQMWLIYYLDLKVLGGFDTELNRKNPFEDYEKDYGTEVVKEVPDLIKKWIDDTVSKIGIKEVDFSFDEFVSFRDGWSLPGASVQGTAKRVVFKSSKKKASVRVKNKWFAMLEYSDDEIVKECLKGRIPRVRPFVKLDEPAACRTVQCYDTYALIRCCYLEQALGDLNAHGKWTTIGVNPREKQKVRKDIFSLEQGTWLCTDQSQFDVNQPKAWVVYALKSLYKRIGARNPHMGSVISAELKSLEKVMLDFENRSLEWGKGVLSGYLFTALLDSILNRAETRSVLEMMRRRDVCFERYQGDDAIVRLRDWIDRQEVSRIYKSLGLEIHPSKTWVTKRNTEYLHEIYYCNGAVYGFPARAWRAIAWKKPVTGVANEFGSQKFNSLIDTIRMAMRRGLLVEDILRRVVKPMMENFDEGKFQAWIKTPSVLGGFGAGMRGRVAIDVQTLRDDSFDVFVKNVSNLDKLWKSAVETRISSACPIPGIVNIYRFAKVRGEGKMPKLKISRYAELPVLRIDWEVKDLKFHPDAYNRKLNLEWKLKSGERIEVVDLPEGFLGLHTVDGVYRKYRKVVAKALSVESAMTAAESFVRVSDWINRAWAGVALDWSLGHLRECDTFWKQLARSLITAVKEWRVLAMQVYV